ncbi:MAG TPA: hypothetical protein VJG32_09010 [Anaerolineae bacterium]|nr:hypothetical protein [Anaerolineae bacterium]
MTNVLLCWRLGTVAPGAELGRLMPLLTTTDVVWRNLDRPPAPINTLLANPKVARLV